MILGNVHMKWNYSNKGVISDVWNMSINGVKLPRNNLYLFEIGAKRFLAWRLPTIVIKKNYKILIIYHFLKGKFQKTTHSFLNERQFIYYKTLNKFILLNL